MLAYEGEVMLVQTEGEMARALNFLKKETLLGFDTESRPSFKKGKSYPTSLIQLAGSELVVLIRLNLTPFCGALAGLLADPGITAAFQPLMPRVTRLTAVGNGVHPGLKARCILLLHRELPVMVFIGRVLNIPFIHISIHFSFAASSETAIPVRKNFVRSVIPDARMPVFAAQSIRPDGSGQTGICKKTSKTACRSAFR